MNKDIRLALGFWSHPKTKKLQKRIGLEAVRSLQILWMWAAQNRPDGVLTEMDTEAVEIAADWSGKDGEFLSELIGLRWVDDVDGVLSLHDWAEHNGWAAKAEERSNAARLSRLSRSNPGKANEFKAAGRVGCTVEEYNLYANPTTVERPLNDRTTTVERGYTNRTTPAPAPAPSPAPGKLEEKIQGASAPARDHGPAEYPGKPEQPEAAKPKPHARFSPPTVEQVQARILEQCYLHADAEGFVNFYASKGWMVGKSPMKDWGAALAGWEARAKKAASDSSSPQGRFGKRTDEQIVADVCAGCI